MTNLPDKPLKETKTARSGIRAEKGGEREMAAKAAGFITGLIAIELLLKLTLGRSLLTDLLSLLSALLK